MSGPDALAYADPMKISGRIDATVRDPERLAALERTGLLDSGPEESFERLAALAKRLVDAPVALVSLVDADRQYFKCCLGLAEPFASARETPLSHSICRHALTSAGPLVIPDAQQDPRTVDGGAVTELGARAYLGIPLVDCEGHVLGSFCVLDDEPREWTDDEVAIMSDLASSVMAEIELRELALERDRAADQVAQNERRLRSIMDSLFIFVGMLETDGTLVEANTAALAAAGLEADDVLGRPFWETYWWSWDPATQDQLRAAVGRASEGVASRYDAEVRLAGGERTVIDFQIVPLVDDLGQVVGIVPSGLDISERKRFEDDLARLAEIEAAQRRQAENLLTLARALTAAVDVADIVDAVTSIGGEVVGAAFSNIAFATGVDHTAELRHGTRLDTSIIERWPTIPVDDSSPLGACLVSGLPVYLPHPTDIAERFPAGAADCETAGFRAIAAVPVTGAQRAAVGFAWSDPVEFTPALQNALGIVGQLTGQALSRAAMYERERDVAHQLQRSLLPQELPHVSGAKVAARYVAGAAGLEVGGDWYDVAALGDDHWVVAVGDVVGRGLSAAAAMGKVRSAFNALTSAAHDVPGLVESLDQFTEEVAEARLSTMVVAEFEAHSGELRVVSAGHLPPMVRRVGGTVERIVGGGPPLGFSASVTRDVLVDRLEPGDCLLLYTDGLVERRDEPIDVGLARLHAALEAVGDQHPDTLCDRVLEAMLGGSEDDVAVMAVVRDLDA